jgi:hypothetical protein
MLSVLHAVYCMLAVCLLLHAHYMLLHAHLKTGAKLFMD